MWLILLYLFIFANAKICKPLCKNNIFFNTTHQLMNELQYKTTNEIQILELELKMVIIARTIELQKQIDEEFKVLSEQHQKQSDKFEFLLNRIGLSPAREDEIHKIVEMEQTVKRKNTIVQSIYD